MQQIEVEISPLTAAQQRQVDLEVDTNAVTSALKKGKTLYACKLCHKTFQFKHHLNAHAKTHTGEREHVCMICSKVFIFAHTLNTHILLQHKDETPYQCRQCNESFTLKHQLLSHLREHSEECLLNCFKCGREFIANPDDQTEPEPHAGQQQQPYTCEQCTDSLARNVQRAYVCAECGLAFTHRHHLEQHASCHAGAGAHARGHRGDTAAPHARGRRGDTAAPHARGRRGDTAAPHARGRRGDTAATKHQTLADSSAGRGAQARAGLAPPPCPRARDTSPLQDHTDDWVDCAQKFKNERDEKRIHSTKCVLKSQKWKKRKTAQKSNLKKAKLTDTNSIPAAINQEYPGTPVCVNQESQRTTVCVKRKYHITSVPVNQAPPQILKVCVKEEPPETTVCVKIEPIENSVCV